MVCEQSVGVNARLPSQAPIVSSAPSLMHGTLKVGFISVGHFHFGRLRLVGRQQMRRPESSGASARLEAMEARREARAILIQDRQIFFSFSSSFFFYPDD